MKLGWHCGFPSRFSWDVAAYLAGSKSRRGTWLLRHWARRFQGGDLRVACPHVVMSCGLVNELTTSHGRPLPPRLLNARNRFTVWVANFTSLPMPLAAEEPELSGLLPCGSGPIHPLKPNSRSRLAARYSSSTCGIGRPLSSKLKRLSWVPGISMSASEMCHLPL